VEPRRDACDRAGERGLALVTVLLVLAIFLVLALALMVHGQTERVVAVNEQDHLKTLAFAEAGVSWVRRVIYDLPPTPFVPDPLSDLLDGPDDSDSADDNLIGLRDLSLTASSQLTLANENTASAVVLRDFDGGGTKRWELLRFPDGDGRRAHLYVRLDDNWDDDPDEPANNEPLVNRDKSVIATVVAEYPVFVGTNGVEVPNRFPERGRARRTLVASFGRIEPRVTAILSGGDLDLAGALSVCGECGNTHANGSTAVDATASVCGDATATGAWTGSSAGVDGLASGGRPPLSVPVIDPYDDLYVPEPDDFGLLSCPAVTTNPDRGKYFALVPDGTPAGRVYKAFWDATDGRWEWDLLDDLNGGSPAVTLHDCGHEVVGGVDDGDTASFYGFRLTGTPSAQACAACGTADGDESLCVPGSDDFTSAIHVTAPGTPPVLPGSLAPDGVDDLDAESRLAGLVWELAGDTVYSPLYGAVVFVMGDLVISGSPANAGSLSYCSTTGCVASVPNGMWQASFVVTGSVTITGSPDIAPANAAAGYVFQIVAGRDVWIAGDVSDGATPCSAASCPVTGPTDLVARAGIVAAHEQVRISGDPSLYGFVVAEDAIDCSSTVDADDRGASILDGAPEVYFDCDNPPNPWRTDGIEMTSWQERF
jgi:hypothetical protein